MFSKFYKKIFPQLILTYTEMHYRFWFFPSFYKKREPEILFDAPTRIDLAQNLPITFIAKDSHKYPITLHSIIITTVNNEVLYSEQLDQEINKQFDYKILQIDRNLLVKYNGMTIELNAEAQISINGKKKTISIHNLKQLSHPPLKIYLSKNSFPDSDTYLWGDMHVHSNYTDDQVEFGAPVESLAVTAKAFGIDFQPITDHSYDLDDEIGYHYKPSKKLIRWSKLAKDVKKYSNEHVILIRGEEVSSGNKNGENVHLLIYNHSDFIPGTGDGGEIWFNYIPTNKVANILTSLPDSILAVAAHPSEPVPKAQKFFLNRGNWDFKQPDRLTGFQIFNGLLQDSFLEGKKQWVKTLLNGKKQFIYAGSDAHGNFNHYRQIGIPPFTLKEHKIHLYGSGRTGVISKKNKNDILQNLKSGKCIITNSYGITLTIINETGTIFNLGETANGNTFELQAAFSSSEEFGSITQVKIFIGDLKTKTESILLEKNLEKMIFKFKLRLNTKYTSTYIRAEAYGFEKIAMTNPIWISQK